MSKLPKQVNPLSVLKPSVELTTSARVKLMKARKHIQKLNDVELYGKVNKAVMIIESLERIVKAELSKEQHNERIQKDC